MTLNTKRGVWKTQGVDDTQYTRIYNVVDG